MAKATKNWFRHSVNAHLNSKIYNMNVNDGLKYVGAYWNIIEMCAAVAIERGDGVDKFEFHKSRFIPLTVKKRSHLIPLLAVLGKNRVLNFQVVGDQVILTDTQVYEYIGFYSPKEKKENKERKGVSSSSKKIDKKQPSDNLFTHNEKEDQKPVQPQVKNSEATHPITFSTGRERVRTSDYGVDPVSKFETPTNTKDDYDLFLKTFFGISHLGKNKKEHYEKIDEFIRTTGRSIKDLQQAAYHISFMKENKNKYGFFTQKLENLLDPEKNFDKYLDNSLSEFFIDKNTPNDTINFIGSKEDEERVMEELKRKGILK